MLKDNYKREPGVALKHSIQQQHMHDIANIET